MLWNYYYAHLCKTYYLALLNFAPFFTDEIFNYNNWGRFTFTPQFSMEMCNVWAPSNVLFNCAVCRGHCGFPFAGPRIKNVSLLKTSDRYVYSSENLADLSADTGDQTSLTPGQKIQCISWATSCSVAGNLISDVTFCLCIFCPDSKANFNALVSLKIFLCNSVF